MKNLIKKVVLYLFIACFIFGNALSSYALEAKEEKNADNKVETVNDEESGEVEIIQEPKKTDYNVGEKFKPAGLKFKLPTGKTITYSALNSNSFRFEPSLSEELTSDVEYITVFYKDYKFDILITVNANEEESISTNVSEKLAETVAKKESLKDSSVYGTATENESDGTTVEVVQLPKKTDYKEGEKFKPNGLKFKLPSGKTVTYSILNSHLFKFNPTINSELTSGVESILATYDEYTFDIPITVEAKNQNTGSQNGNNQSASDSDGDDSDGLVYGTIEIKGIEQFPAKVKYKKGEKFNPSGLKVKLPNGKIISYNATNNHLFSFDPKVTEALTKNDDHIVVTYRNGVDYGEFYIPIEVQQKIIAVTSNIDTLYSAPGQPFDPTGLTLNLEMEDGTIETITYGEDTKDMFKFEPDIVGDDVVDGMDVKVKFAGFGEIDESWDLDCKIQEANEPVIVTPPKQLLYKSGEKFKPDGLKLYMKLDGDGAPEFEGIERWDGSIFVPDDMFVTYDDGVISSKIYEGWHGNADQFTFEPSLDTPLVASGDEVEEQEIKIKHLWTNHVYTQKVKVLPSVKTVIVNNDNKDDTSESSASEGSTSESSTSESSASEGSTSESSISESSTSESSTSESSANEDKVTVEWHLNKDEYWKYEMFDPTGTYLIINKNGSEKKVEYNEDTKKFFSFEGDVIHVSRTNLSGEKKYSQYPLAPGKILYRDVEDGIKITYNDGEVSSTKSITVKDCPNNEVRLDLSKYNNKYKVGDLRNLDSVDFVIPLPDGSTSRIPFAIAEEQCLVFVYYLHTPLTKENSKIDIYWQDTSFGGADAYCGGWEWQVELYDENGERII